MYLNELHIGRFRNYSLAHLCFDRGVNYIIGGNAQGKSNLVEAVYYLSTGRSFRTNRVANLIQWGTDAFRLKAGLVEGEGPSTVDVSYDRRKVSLTLDGRRAGRMGELVGILNTIIFCPEDLYIVKGSPCLRRRFIDIHISQLHPPYLRALARYGRALKQRNAAMRLGKRRLSHWDEQLVESGLEVMGRRSRYIERLSGLAREAHSRISPQENLLLEYRSLYPGLGGGERARKYHDALKSVRRIEERRGMTLVGPHMDDIAITLNDRDARQFASDGQRRSIIVSLKVAQFMMAREVLKRDPLLLIDDPLAELDIERREAVMPFFSGGVQCIITALEEGGLLPGKRFRVRAGRIDEIG